MHYLGLDKIELPVSIHKIKLSSSKETLIIEDISGYYPKIKGDKFKRIAEKEE